MQQEQDTINLALGIITYLRCLFSEDSFRSENVDGMELKVLRNTIETTRMIKWIHSLNKYKEKLHKVVLGIYSVDKKAPNNHRLVEMYSIDVKAHFDFKGICRNLQKMSLLRGKYLLRMKVFTTAFIEIDGFKRTDELWDLACLRPMALDGMKIYLPVAENTQEQIIPESQVQKISCTCTIDTNEKEMILCQKCNSWVHAACHGYFSSKDKRIKRDFECFRCMEIVSKELRDCCIYRRLLSVIYNERVGGEEEGKRLNRQALQDFIAKRLKISQSFTVELIRKLIKDGFVENKKGHLEIIKTRESKEKIKEYFNGKRMECLISMYEISCDL